MLIFLAFANDDDKSKFDYLYNRYVKLLLYKAYAVLHDYSLAEDAVSEAFIRVYKNLGKIVHKYSFFKPRNFDTLFNLLDIDKQNTPSFYLSQNYSAKYKKTKTDIIALNAQKEKAFTIHKQNIINDLGLTKLEEKITVSRMNNQQIDKLTKSNYFYIDD